jgi:hypothetical protein
MILNEGKSPTTGQQVISIETVKTLFENKIPHLPNFGRRGIPAAMPALTNAIPDLYPQDGCPPQGWSIAGVVNLVANKATGRRENSVWWSGLPNIYWWIDPTTGIAGILATQILPFWGEPIDFFERND